MCSFQLNLQRTADHWSAEGAWETGRGIYWLELPAVQRRLNQKISGRPDVGWVRYTLEHHFTGRLPLDCCLSLGCGEGGLERQLASLRAFMACEAFDVAEGRIAKAQVLAQQAGYDHIRYAVQDANEIQLSPRQYDAVWSAATVHHFERLEHVFEQVAAGLKPGGLFILNEYIGPNRFQFPPRQRQVIQACHDLLPADYRRLNVTALDRSLTLRGKGDLRWLVRRVLDKLRDGDLLGAVWRRVQRAQAVSAGVRPVKTTPNLPRSAL